MPAPVLATLAGSFTISVWVNTTQTFGFDGDPAYTDAGIVAADIPGQYNDIVPLALTGGGLGFNTGGSSDDTLSSTLDINDGNYHHIVVERNQALGEKWIFIDGVYNNTDFATTNLLTIWCWWRLAAPLTPRIQIRPPRPPAGFTMVCWMTSKSIPVS